MELLLASNAQIRSLTSVIRIVESRRKQSDVYSSPHSWKMFEPAPLEPNTIYLYLSKVVSV